MKPTVGRIVHYFNHGVSDQPYAAIVTKVHPEKDEIDLTIFAQGSSFFANVSEGPSDTEAYWLWPERQPE